MPKRTKRSSVLLKVRKKMRLERSKGVNMTKHIKISICLLISILITVLLALPICAEAEEVSKAPGGEDITLALLIVSGLLAIASFIAFLISLSSVRRIPPKKDKE